MRYDALKGTNCMQIEATKKLFTVDEYYRMAETGILGPNDRVQLNYPEPEPDIVVLKYRPDFYKGKEVRANDALLVVEVFDTTLRYDHQVTAICGCGNPRSLD